MDIILIRQSDLSAFSRCAQQKKLNDQAKAGLLTGGEQLSQTAYGSVMHHAISTLERLQFQGRDDAVERAHATFDHYWDPVNISAICDPVTIWAARQTYAGLLRKGHQTIDLYGEHLAKDVSKLLALEIEFTLPLEVDGVVHDFHGTMDRLALRKLSGQSYVEISDFKTGQDQKYLRWNVQFTAYGWATTQRAFWTDAWGEEQGNDLYERFRLLARRGTWISLRNGVDRQDAGWRGEQDYARFKVAVREYVKAVELDVYPLSLKGDVCFWCRWREICGGVPVPDEQHGRPEPVAVKP